MRRLSAGLIAAVSTIAVTSIASAADLPVKGPAYKPEVATPYSWQGFYVGGNVGYGWGGDPVTFSPGAPAFAAGVPTSLADNPSGVIGGLQYGTNWQFNRIVLGWESDFAFSNITASQTIVLPGPGTGGASSAEQKMTWFSTTRGRAGYTITDNLLLYGTGGLASGRASVTSSVLQAGCPGVGNCLAGSDSKTLWGWTAGGGLEYGIGRWSMRVEYLHYDLGNLNYNFSPPVPTTVGYIASSTKFSGDIIRGGINYRFDWTPWELIFGRR